MVDYVYTRIKDYRF